MKSFISFKWLFIASLLCGVATSNIFATSESGTMLKVFTCEDGDGTHFYVQNLQPANITTTFQMSLTNLHGNAEFPYTTTVAGNQTVEAFVLSPIQTNSPWNFSYVRSSTLGSADAVPDDAFIYSLPYAAGRSFRVSQGYHGRFSHSGPDEYAIDWRMPVGTPVHAARGGLVIKSKDDDAHGGADRKYEKSANCVLIQHADGTIGVYGHLKKGGNKVKVGDQVKTGELIALSGNTGFSNGPHLHFAVFMTRDGSSRLSLPVKFQSADHGVITPADGGTYTAAPSDEPPVNGSRLASNSRMDLPVTP
jgi:murein DD-endopeptidase MepM/ murein hydrolase activator NlpD